MAKNLIVYYSRKGENYYGGVLKNLKKGNTEIAAEYIQNAVGGDLFEVETVAPYPARYYDCTRVAKQEFLDDARPEIKAFLESLEAYDTIFVAFPNWCSTLPMCMFTFLEHYDLAGKTIAPLATHEGGGMGRSESDLNRICVGANVIHGLDIRGCDVGTSEAVISNWAKHIAG